MLSQTVRNRLVSVFVVIWLSIFNYESLRAGYLEPFFHRELPKLKFLFPPAGWIMFYRVEESEVRAEVYGIKNGRPELIDPHKIFPIRWIGYDNIHRNVLVSVLHEPYAPAFGRYLRRKFPEYEKFAVMAVLYPSDIRYHNKRHLKLLYEC